MAKARQKAEAQPKVEARQDVIPCQCNADLRKKIKDFAEVLKTQAHTLGSHGLDEREFYHSGLFRGAIERIRGQFSSEMREKREFVAAILDYMRDKHFIKDWSSAGEENRHDYTITLPDERMAVVELKGCLDGNNTTIFERPSHAQEFVIWSICSNAGADPRLNAWSGIHTRLSAEIIHESKLVDGLVIWDWLCGTLGRPCPKVDQAVSRLTTVKQFRLPPPCIYLFPPTIPSVRNNPCPKPQELKDVRFLRALHECFGGRDDEVNQVHWKVEYQGNDVVRTTTIQRGNVIVTSSDPTPIRRK